jgi:hypothetical protein
MSPSWDLLQEKAIPIPHISTTLESYHKHRQREKMRNGIMLALAILLVLLNLWVYLSK